MCSVLDHLRSNVTRYCVCVGNIVYVLVCTHILEFVHSPHFQRADVHVAVYLSNECSYREINIIGECHNKFYINVYLCIK